MRPMPDVHAVSPAPRAATRAHGVPLISVVMPSYNQGRWIDDALSSLFGQNDPALEVIVVDGGSTDETHDILDRWRHRLHACICEPDGGQAEALAKGFALANGEILGWLNSDDMHLPWTLRAIRNEFEHDAELDCVHGDRVVIDEHGVVTGYRMLPGHSAYFLNRWPWTHQETCFWRRALMERCGGIDTSLRFAMDYDLFVRFFSRGRCVHLPLVLGAFRWHAESKSFLQQSTVGHDEIALVRRRYGVVPMWFERPIGTAMSFAIRLMRIGRKFNRHDSSRHPPDVGFRIRELWIDSPSEPPQPNGHVGA